MIDFEKYYTFPASEVSCVSVGTDVDRDNPCWLRVDLKNGGDEIVSCCRMCISCYHADRKREHDGRVRCTRWSRWVDPEAKPCEEYSDFTQEQYDELRKMLGIPGDKSE